MRIRRRRPRFSVAIAAFRSPQSIDTSSTAGTCRDGQGAASVYNPRMPAPPSRTPSVAPPVALPGPVSVETRAEHAHGGPHPATAGEPGELGALKADSFGRIALMRDEAGMLFVRRDLGHVPLWLRLPAWWLARREARGLRQVLGADAVPQLLRWDGRRLDRSYLEGAAMYQRPPRGDRAYFRLARRRLQALHRLGLAHNDLAKEANWLVLADGTPAIIDFQLAVRGRPRARWMRLLAREDLRHLLKHKRTYCPEAITPVERRLLKRRSWVRELWFAMGKPVYRFVTRRVLKWEDNEGQGPKP